MYISPSPFYTYIYIYVYVCIYVCILVRDGNTDVEMFLSPGHDLHMIGFPRFSTSTLKLLECTVVYDYDDNTFLLMIS